MGNSAPTALYIQGNYLNNTQCSVLKTYLEEQKAKIFDVGKNHFGFHTTKIPFCILINCKEEVKKIIESLPKNAFIRVSNSNVFQKYEEFRG